LSAAPATSARKYQRPVINGIALIIVVLCIISLTEMLLITTPIVFGSMVSWVQSLPEVPQVLDLRARPR
jgi:hypothetical protein